EAIAEYREAIRSSQDRLVVFFRNRQDARGARMGDRLPGVLNGKDLPRDAVERAAFANLCLAERHFGAAARLYAEAFAVDSKLAENRGGWSRPTAACAAALAGCGQGKDAAGLDENKRDLLRRRALEWLRADLEAVSGQLNNKDTDPVRHKLLVFQVLQWLADA